MKILPAASRPAIIGSLLIWALLWACRALATDEAVIEVKPAGSGQFTIEPRRTVTGIFSISNHAFKELSLKSRVGLPAGWNLVATDLAERMYGEDRAISLVSLHVPRTAIAGRYRITYAVEADGQPSMEDSCAIEVEVLPVVKLVLRPTEMPDYVIAGDAYEAAFALTNQGNASAVVNLRPETAGDLGFSVEPAALGIAPGETRQVRVVMSTDPDIRRRLTERMTLIAETGDPEVRARSTISVDVIPRISIIEDPYYRTPADFTLRYVGENDGIDKSRVQAEITGGGPIDAAGSRRTSFHIVGPDSRGNGTLGEPDEYFFAYGTSRYEASLGDQSFSVSQLLESGRYGFGVKTGIKAADVNIGAYHMQTRWDQPREEQTAATVDYQVGATSAVGISYLAKTTSSRSHLLGLEGRLKPLADTDVEAEYSHGLGEESGGQAYRLGIRAAGKSAQYLFRLTHADPDFRGYYSDIDFIATALTVTPASDLRLGVGIRRESRNLELDPGLYSAQQDGSFDLTADYRLRSATNLFLGYRLQQHRDRLDSSAYNTEESAVRSSVTYRAKRWDLHAGIEAGGTRDEISNRWGALSRYTFSANVRPSDRQTYRGYVFVDNDALDDGSRHATGGVSASLRIRDGTSLDASVKSDHFRHATAHDRAVFRAGLTQAVRRRATARLEAYYGTYENGTSSDRFGVLCEIAVPVGVPLSRRPNVGSLKGRVYDAETGEAVPNVVLRLNGLTAVTDEHGRFAFPSVKADRYALGVDRGTIGLDRTAVVQLPIDVDIPAGGKAVVDIGVTRSSTLRGEVGLYAFARKEAGFADAEAADVVRDGGLAGAVAELSCGPETRYALTDAAGGFQFADLRPGRWQLKIRANDLPDYTYLESDALEVDLKPGEATTASVRVLPRHRQIRMREDGGVIEEVPTSRR
jgi:hypothetical protein